MTEDEDDSLFLKQCITLQAAMANVATALRLSWGSRLSRSIVRHVQALTCCRVHVARYAVAGEKAVKVQHVIHVPPPPPAPPGCADLDTHCAQVMVAGSAFDDALRFRGMVLYD
jgi:hypothetical protein